MKILSKAITLVLTATSLVMAVPVMAAQTDQAIIVAADQDRDQVRQDADMDRDRDQDRDQDQDRDRDQDRDQDQDQMRDQDQTRDQDKVNE